MNTSAVAPAPHLPPLPVTFSRSRDELQRVATHVLARRRFARTGKFGLRATPSGFGTPAFGPEHEVVRLSGTWLVRERTGERSSARTLDLANASLADAAALVDVDLDVPFEAGADTPPVGDPDAPLAIDRDVAELLAAWYQFGWHVLDATTTRIGRDGEPSAIQLWPEHFDAALDVAATPERRVNLGAAPGDSAIEEPYLYVGPWTGDRPGDPAFWNEPFGAVLRYDQLRASDDAYLTATRFLAEGVELLRT